MAIKLRENPLQASNTHTNSKTSYAVWSPGDGSAIAATESGTFFHVKDEEIQAFEIESTSDFYDVHGFAYDDVWAVGTFGAIWRFNGLEWSPIQNNPTEGTYDPTWFEAVWGTSSKNIFVCGDNSEILHFDGKIWKYLLKWDRVGPKEFPDRWYSLAGTDDGTIYAVGSPYRDAQENVKAGFVRIKPGESPELLDVQSSTPFLNAICRIPGTDELLLCGGGGTLRRVRGNQTFPEAEDIIKPKDKFYAIDAVSKDNIIVVGWGVILIYDGVSWERKTVAGNPYLEGIAYSGDGKYTAVGWMGKILKFDIAENRWYNLQNGRVRTTLAITALDDGRVIATADGGNLIVGDKHGNLQQKFAQTLDLNVTAKLGKNRVLLAGQRGYIKEVEICSNGDLKTISETGGHEPWSVYCGSSFNDGVYLGCSRLEVKKWFRGELTPIEGIAKRIREVDSRDDLGLQKLIHISDKEFIVRVNKRGNASLSTYFIDLERPKAQKLDIDTSDIIVGNTGVIHVISKNIAYSVNNIANRNSWVEIVNLNSKFISADEFVSCTVHSGEKLIVGGSRGTIVQIEISGAVTLAHSGSYTKITCLDISANDIIYTGHEWGRLKRIDIVKNQIQGYSISAPTWWAALASNSGTLLCGQDGALGFINSKKSKVELDKSLISKDYLCCVAVNDSVKCIAGVENIMLWKENSTLKIHNIPDTIITTINYFNSVFYLGTSKGDVLTVQKKELESSEFSAESMTRILQTPLESAVVDIAVVPEGIRITCEDGKVYFSENDVKLIHDIKATIRRGAIPQNSEKAYLAGEIIRNFESKPKRKMFVAEITDNDTIEELDFPTGFGGKLLTWDVSAYAADEMNGFWFGGQSGELVIKTDTSWYQVSTGIGNQLHSVTSAHDRLVVCGRFGAVRFGDMKIFRKRIEELSAMEENLVKASEKELGTPILESEFNLNLVERRINDIAEYETLSDLNDFV